MTYSQEAEPSEIPRHLALAVIAEDPDYLMLRVTVADGAFAGSTHVYENPDVAAEIRAALGGFPRTSTDCREITLGAFGREYAGGGVRLMLRTISRAGQSVLEAELEDDASFDDPPRSVKVRLAVDSSTVDSFLQELGRIKPGGSGTAVLRGSV